MSRIAGRMGLVAALSLIAGAGIGDVYGSAPMVEPDAEGTRRAREREQAMRSEQAARYAETPAAIETRQQRRARERQTAKAGRL